MSFATCLQRFHARPGFLLKRAQQVAAAIFLEECRESGLTSSQYGALCALAEYPGVDQIALGTLVGLDRSTVGLVIRLLSARGLVERYADQHDRRRKRIRLTPAGSRALHEVAPAARRVSRRMLSVLPPSERRHFIDLLARFLAGHEATIDVSVILAGTFEAAAGRRLPAPAKSACTARQSRRSGKAIGERKHPADPGGARRDRRIMDQRD